MIGANPEARGRETWGTEALNQVREARREYQNAIAGRRGE
jgi:hypothetical protein